MIYSSVTQLVGATPLLELNNLRKKYGINAVALRQGETISVTIDPTVPLNRNQQLVVIADTDKLKKLRE